MRRGVFVLLLLLSSAMPLYAREGFGFTKKAVVMSRTLPPAMNVSASRLKIVAKTDRSREEDDAESLRRYIEEAIRAGDERFSFDGTPQLTISLFLGPSESREEWETKTETEYRQTGTRSVWNSYKKKYEEKPVYDYVPVTKHLKTVTASLDGSYCITDGKGRTLDSGSIDRSFSRSYEEGNGAPSTDAVASDLLHDAAITVASRIVPTNTRVMVMLPKGSFESFIPLAESGAWDRYLASVQQVLEKRDRESEAYRQYALGVGKEAVAYTTKNPRQAAALLREAQTHYQNAVQYNASEALFGQAYSSLLSAGTIPPPLPRVSESLAQYDAWASGPAPTASKAAAKTLRNDTIVEMVKAGLSEENVLLAIDSADATEFDTEPDALIALRKAGVSRTVIARMQKRAKR
ncbi:MAG TPA: hypothetical protein VGR02_07020 [Thermoanaerobaculia bacterium]|jgi:hypothetical protein|nr:hypothetical protein [Thermoanaerobaculia bacterium]